MENMRRTPRILYLFLTTFFFFLTMSPMAYAEGDILVIGHPDIPVNSLSTDNLSDIFQALKGQWPDGGKIKVVMLKQGPTHEAFAETVLNIKAAQLKEVWKKVIFSGAGITPKVVHSEEDCVTFITSTKGAIGYISSTTPHTGVKVLEIQ